MKGDSDFVPENMQYSDFVELEQLLRSRRYLEFIGAEKKRKSNEGCVSEKSSGNREVLESEEVSTNNLAGQNIQQNKDISSDLNVNEPKNPDLDEIYGSEVDAQSLEFKRGDEMETIPPANIG